MIISHSIKSYLISCAILYPLHAQTIFDWAVIGGGPGGIITVGVLLDVGVSPEKIIWIDNDFLVGRMGQYYATVPANNKSKRLVEFITMCAAFREVKTPAMQALFNAHPEKEYPLKLIIDPLQDITDVFLTKVNGVRGTLTHLDFSDDAWSLAVKQQHYRAHRVVLATGAHPKTMNAGTCVEIDLDRALNKEELAKCIAQDDTIAIFGGAHSAVLIMKFLCELGATRIINFYKSPLYYLTAEQQALRIKTCQLHGDPLSGMAAQWAREVLDVNPPGNLVRVKISEAALKAWLPVCTKIICAAGFEKNQLPVITGITCAHDSTTGVIGPHLFGIGIAFPEFLDEGNGRCSYRIGLREFMKFAQRVIPEWMHKSAINEYGVFEDFIVFSQL